MVTAKLLLVDDETVVLDLMSIKLKRLSYEVSVAYSGKEALAILQKKNFDVLVTDFHMPDMNGDEVIAGAIAIDPLLQCIVVTGFGNIDSAIQSMGAGALNYLTKPIDFKELDITIKKSLEKRQLLQEINKKQEQVEEYQHHLEELVEQRTRALTDTNKVLKREIEERKRLEFSLRAAKAAAEKANKAKSEFLANMSHEIRTPMTSAIGLLNLILDSELSPKQKTYLEMARSSTVMMHNLLNDILDFSKIEAGKLNLESVSFSPRNIINSVIDLQSLQAEEKHIHLISAVDDDVPQLVVGDPNRLRQIILNLVANSLKFTHHGEVIIHCKKLTEQSKTSSLKEKYQYLHFSIQDSGIGMNKEEMDSIFEAFTQVNKLTNHQREGVGLGLNISNKLVTLMGGKLWVESESRQGSTFHFTCKFGKNGGRGENMKRAEGQNITSMPESPDNRAFTVLLVEDDQSNQWVFRELLIREGYKVVNMSDGILALEEFDQRHFDLILLDLQLPTISGFELTHRVRLHEKNAGIRAGQHVPIIAMTGSLGENENQQCIDAGMDDFIAKPFTADQLFCKILKNLRKRSHFSPEKLQKKEKKMLDISLLAGDIFNEKDALKKSSGNREKMIQRVRAFVHQAPQSLDIIQTYIEKNEETLLEQELHNLNTLAMEVGAINFADELFSLQMRLRRNQGAGVEQVDILLEEFFTFRNERTVQTLLEGIDG